MPFNVALPKGLSLQLGPDGTLFLSKFDYKLTLGDLTVGEIESIKNGFHLAQVFKSGEKSSGEKNGK